MSWREHRSGEDGPWAGPGRPWPGRWGDRPPRRRRAGLGFLGCLSLAIALVIGLVSTLATWVAAALLGILAPSAAPSTLTAVTVIVVLVVALLAGVRVFVTAVRPLGEIAAATTRLADGEPGVRVDPRGPRPVRGLGTSFNTMAERLDRSRDDRRALLADVTHELRTPLTVVQGGLEAMLDGVHPIDEDHLAPILAETAVMDRLLDDLRTLSLADAGALTLHREPTDLPAIVREAAAAHSAMADAKRVELLVTGDARLVASVDPLRYREIAANLLANAIRHTPPGGHVEVDIRATDGVAVLTLRDDGEGIPSGEIERVFDRYQHRSDTGGTGLGLAIVRDLTEAHGGSVGAESDGVPGRGATFRVAIPIRD